VGTVVHLCRDLFESLKSLGTEPSVVLTSRLYVALMMELDDKMNYNVDHLTMLSMLIETCIHYYKVKDES
jgi:hypothetical protein